MDDRTEHTHRCGCGVTWTCSKPDCYVGDECSRCEDEALTIYLDVRQPVLEPVDALLVGPKET